jgi:serine/threonine protein phosphatase PrpC
MKFERGFAQHVGSRQEQQDAGFVLADDAAGEQLVLVADGMGGHAGGSIASAQLAETAQRVWGEHRKSPLEPKRLLERIIREGHEAINRAGAEKGLTPRSTCAMLMIRDGTAHWAHVGDSRIYRLRDGQVTRLTRDHSVVQMLVDLGKVSEEEMGTHPDQNRLTQSLGGDASPMPDFGNDAVKAHDAFLVCSDGLWEMIPPAEMAAALAAKKLGDDGARHLVERAFDRAKPKSDNITVALLRIGGQPTAAAASPDEAPTMRLADATGSRATGPRAAHPRAARGSRWMYATATVLAVGAAGAAVMVPWDQRTAVDTQPSATGRGTVTPPELPKQTDPPKLPEQKSEEKKEGEKPPPKSADDPNRSPGKPTPSKDQPSSPPRSGDPHRPGPPERPSSDPSGTPEAGAPGRGWHGRSERPRP